MTNPSIQHVKMACHAGYKFENKRVDKCAFKFFILRIKKHGQSNLYNDLVVFWGRMCDETNELTSTFYCLRLDG